MMVDRYLEGVRAGLEAAAKVCEDRMPVIQCMSVEPIISALDDAAQAIRSLDPETLK